MKYETIRWKRGRVELIDQTLLPGKLRYIACLTVKDMYAAIKEMKVRGAPAIGVAGAYGVYLGIRESLAANFKDFQKQVKNVIKYLAKSRPTARNLFWALERIDALVERNADKPVEKLKRAILDEANTMLVEDKKICRMIGEHGRKLIKQSSNILTHCNAGGLATCGCGTALAIILSAKDKINTVYADETRPRLQGARLTVWELNAQGIRTILICDNMAASFMAKGDINGIIVGADRITLNGDTANKIGTYNLAVLAKYHKIPFYVAAPISTFDLNLAEGGDIPIEERSPEEIKKIGGKYITLKNTRVRNPAFDVTPAKLITAIVTECGIIYKPNKKIIKKIINPTFNLR